ncbi:MAG: BREX-3 system phosphatase PglZ [Bacillaceae bacterium]|nr:BREX-3 system phosphatase PglZ [Bacillaceae bacterium]
MRSWREYVLHHFKEPIPSVSLVSDPDALLLDEQILSELGEKRIECITYDDPVQFRYIYENNYRLEVTSYSSNVKLVLRTADKDLQIIPFDLLQIGRQLHFSIENIFPKLSTSILRQLPKKDLDSLFSVYVQHQGSSSDHDTCDFLLKKVYKIPYDTINNELDVVRFLLMHHYGNTSYPTVIVDFLLNQLSKQVDLNHFNLKEFFHSSNAFYKYLQEQWLVYLELKSKQNLPDQVKEQSIESIEHMIKNEDTHLFEDPTIQRLVDNLFSEGKLTALSGFSASRLPEWTHIGIVIDPIADERYKINHLLKSIKEEIKGCNYYQDWIKLVQKYSEFKNLCLSISLSSNDFLYKEVEVLEKELDSTFESWLIQNYRSLPSLPYLPYPVMVHQIPHSISHKLQDRKIALLVLDGMSYVQWVQMRTALSKENPDLGFKEHGVFAWIPTITSVSRQAIFTGEMPLYFGKTLDKTSKEETAWKLFWENHGILKSYVGYVKGLGLGEYNKPDILHNPKLRVVGMVVDTIDELIHGSIQGQQGLYEEIKLWLQKGFVSKLINDLLNLNFEVYITSDHGNKESYGIGRISEGVLADTKGERMRIYRERILRDDASLKYGAISWDGVGLPKDVHVLLAKENQAFVPKGRTIVAHGSISPEEVIVPFIKVIREQKI